jgi:predicted tellurium resistance membrane protein TerC
MSNKSRIKKLKAFLYGPFSIMLFIDAYLLYKSKNHETNYRPIELILAIVLFTMNLTAIFGVIKNFRESKTSPK